MLIWVPSKSNLTRTLWLFLTILKIELSKISRFNSRILLWSFYILLKNRCLLWRVMLNRFESFLLIKLIKVLKVYIHWETQKLNGFHLLREKRALPRFSVDSIEISFLFLRKVRDHVALSEGSELSHLLFGRVLKHVLRFFLVQFKFFSVDFLFNKRVL